MSLIYEPAGKAREYSPLALNIYNGCDHGCTYCYTCLIKRSADTNKVAQIRRNFVNTLEKELSKNQHDKQILLSFMCDPYCKADLDLKTTRDALFLLNLKKRAVAVLTKGGKRCLRDVDIFKSFGNRFKIGATLTLLDSSEVEPEAAPTEERLSTLKKLHQNNIKTWVSIEPVIDPVQSIELISRSMPYVHHFKVGKMNHFEKRFNDNVDWAKFLYDAVALLRKNNKPFYIKHDLQQFDIDHILTSDEKNMDLLNVSI
jgi:DNA repair photolyase